MLPIWRKEVAMKDALIAVAYALLLIAHLM